MFLGCLQGGAGVKKGACVQVAAAKRGKDSLCWKGDLAPPGALPPRVFPPSCPLHPPGLWAQESELWVAGVPPPGGDPGHRHQTRGKRQRTLLCRHRRLGPSEQKLELGGERALWFCLGLEGGRRRAQPDCAVPIGRTCICSSQVLCNLCSCFLPLSHPPSSTTSSSVSILSLAGWGCAQGESARGSAVPEKLGGLFFPVERWQASLMLQSQVLSLH